MSVRTELEELARWISSLSEKDAKPTPDVLPRKNWQDIDEDLTDASKKFANVRVEILTRHPRSFVADFAGDVSREAERLAFRAHLLSRRAPPTPKKPPGQAHERDVEQALTHMLEVDHVFLKEPFLKEAEKTQRRRRKREPEESEQEREHELAPPTPLAVLVERALGTVETARDKLRTVEGVGGERELEHLDDVTLAFEEELDVLAEMALSLQQHCKRLDELPRPQLPRFPWMARRKVDR
jgi:hypothetical protein